MFTFEIFRSSQWLLTNHYVLGATVRILHVMISTCLRH